MRESARADVVAMGFSLASDRVLVLVCRVPGGTCVPAAPAVMAGSRHQSEAPLP
jgi:hypothetical protein